MNITTSSSNQSLKIPISNRLVLLFAVTFLSFGLSGPLSNAQDRESDFLQARRRMVERDLRGRGIKDARVLEAMSLVPRHLFVEPKLHRFAYQDRPLPIGEGQTISQPYMVALMTQLLELKGDEKVLEIGTGSGYQAAVLAHLTHEVYTIEIIAPLAKRAKERLGQLGYSNVWIKIGDGFFGWKENAPFDAILLTAAAEKIPEPLWAQLREQGVMIMPLGPERQNQRLVRARKISGQQRIEEITGVVFVPMTGTVEKESR
jgi:protein-L-isoaspartate(D-aspartate) O-methyltransferase